MKIIVPEWKPIVIDGSITEYMISNLGNVISNKYNKQQSIQLQNGPNNCKQVRLRVNGTYRNIRIHRLVALLFVPNPDNNTFVNHIDGNRANPNYLNLEWVSPSQNTKHAVFTGLHSNFHIGEENPSSRYSEQQVHLVCKLLMDGKTMKETAKQSKTSLELVHAILYRNAWKHITSHYDLQNRHRIRPKFGGVISELPDSTTIPVKGVHP